MSLSTAYQNTRISLFSGRLWQARDYQQLLEASAEEIARSLSERRLGVLAVGYNDDDARSLEARIIAQLLDETLILIRPLCGDERAFLTYWTERFEISNVKTLLRAKRSAEVAASLSARLTPMGSFARLNLAELAQVEDIAELLRVLEAGPYAEIVRQARHAYEASHDLFMLDAALDRGYYEGLAQRGQALDGAAGGAAGGATGGALGKLLANLLDHTNLVWLLRYRFNYGLPPAQVYYLLVAAHRLPAVRLPATRLRQLASLDSIEAVLAELPASLRSLLAGADDIPAIFARLDSAAAELASRVLHSSAPALARAFAYLMLREQDLRTVRAVLRGRHLGLARDDILLAMRRRPELGSLPDGEM